jgi:hypothetical protein
MRQRTDPLGSFLVGYHLQQALDSAALQAAQEQLVHHGPKPLKNDGQVKVRVRTAQGDTVPVGVTYDRRKGQRRAGKRSTGVYAGLVV